MSARPWHKRYHSDALSGFMVLTLEERGAFQTILDLIYDRNSPLPDNDALLARYMGVSIRKWKSIRQSLINHGKIKVDDDGNLVNDRAIFEVENALKTSRKHAENGAKGGQKKAENAKNVNENNGSDGKWLGEKPSISEIRDQNLEENEEDKSSSEERGDLVFCGRTVRLRKSDFDAWRLAFHAIPDLNAELVALDSWFEGPGRGKRGSWFHTTAGALSRKHQESLKGSMAEASFTGPC